MATLMEFTPDLIAEIEYPDTDGKPMAESDFQRKYLTYAVEALSAHFKARPDVYVSGNLLIYYEKGNWKAAVAPDVFVVIGADKQERRSYKLWQEPKAPDFVLEITSRSTFHEDQGIKRGLYAHLGVQEYFQYDPTSDYLKPSLQGLQLEGANYQPIPAAQQKEGTLIIKSQMLELELHLLAEEGFRFFDPAAGHYLLSYEEVQAARLTAEKRIAELEARLHNLEP